MITKLLHKTMLLVALCLSCIGCSDETSLQQSVPEGNGQVKIQYKIAGPSLSRATEPGWSDNGWNENLITRIDLFVFNEGATDTDQCYKHIEASAEQGQYLSDKANDYEPLPTDELTYEEVSENNYTYYMVANCPQLANKDNITLGELKQAMIETAITWNNKQASFVMDGIGKREINNQTVTLSFDLSRAAVKIRLAVIDENGTDITSQCKYRFQNRVLTGTSVLAESEKYGKGEDQERTSMTETDEDSFTPLQYDDTEKNIHQVVFYSYPNDWFDTSKLGGQEGAWTIQDYASKDPIVEANQTYILLTAPYGEEGENYYYKIPVNFAMYDYNDKVSFTDAELEEIRDLYRMKRNHIYNITAQINRRGGGLDLETHVSEWYDGGSLDINYANNYAGTLNVITQTPVTTEDGEAYAVVYGDNDKVATFTFRMTQPAGATWTANLTNGSQFELSSASGVASGVGVGETDDPNEGLVTFSVRPTQEYEPGTNPETELYITVMNANGESLGEQLINPDNKYPGTTARIKIRQVSLEQWNEYNNN